MMFKDAPAGTRLVRSNTDEDSEEAFTLGCCRIELKTRHTINNGDPELKIKGCTES